MPAELGPEPKLDIGSLSRITKVAILSVLFLFGCAGRGPLVVTDRPSPDVRLSPEIQLLDVPIERFSAAIDQDGRVHVLASAPPRMLPKELHHLVIGIEGVLNQEVVTTSKSYKSYDHLDIAFDSSGNLHAIVDEDHFVMEEGVWRTLQKHKCTKFISGGEDLFCLSRVEGKDVGAPLNVDWNFGADFSAGVGVCCVLPSWPHYPDKLALARKTPEGWSKLVLFDVETKFEIETASIAADKSGTLHVLYKTGEGGNLDRDLQCAYARIEPMTLEESSESNQGFSSGYEEAPHTFTKVSDRVVVKKHFGWPGLRPGGLQCDDIAADPETGTALITIKTSTRDRDGNYRRQVFSHIVEEGKIGPQVPMYDFDGVIRVEPAGEGRFLALGVWWEQGFRGYKFIYYLEYRDGMWSAPVELGKEKRWLSDVVFLSDLDRRAFALWTNKDRRLIGRWIER